MSEIAIKNIEFLNAFEIDSFYETVGAIIEFKISEDATLEGNLTIYRNLDDYTLKDIKNLIKNSISMENLKEE